MDYWHRASQQAAERSAYAEAMAQADKGLEVLAGAPVSPSATREALELQLASAGPAGAPRAILPEVGTAFARARQLCHRPRQTRPI